MQEQKPAVVYPGNSQGLHINEAGERGAYFVTVQDGDISGMEFIPTDVVRWFHLTGKEALDLSPISSEGELSSLLEDRCRELLARAENRSAIIRMELGGRTSLHRTLGRENFIHDLETHLRGLFSPSDPFLWLDCLIDQTRSFLDREERMSAGDFIAELLELSEEVRSAPARLDEMGNEVLAGIFRDYKRWPNALPPPNAEKLQSLCREAESLLLDLLIPEDEE